MNIYAGNLAYSVTDHSLKEIFEEFGAVDSARVIQDRSTGRSKGFGFVEMPNNDEAKAAINALNGKEIDSRSITVNESRPKPQGGGGGGGNRGGRSRY